MTFFIIEIAIYLFLKLQPVDSVYQQLMFVLQLSASSANVMCNELAFVLRSLIIMVVVFDGHSFTTPPPPY
jgi:hypothetical protein